MGEDGFAKTLGLSTFERDGEGVKVTLPTSSAHQNAGGIVHGGVLAALLDFALGASVVTTLQQGEWCATQALHTEFLRPASPGATLVARARVDRRGKLTAFPSGEVVDADGEVVARATGVWAIRRG